MKKTTGTLMLLLAALIWGTAFVAQSSASDDVGAFTFTAARSWIAFVFLFIIMGICGRFHKEKGVGWKKTIWAGLICGLIFFMASNLQQFGIAAYPEGVAASGRSGFLTATYVVMVALCTGLFGQKKLHPLVWVAVGGCMAGMYFLCLSDGLSGFYWGDGLVLGCAAFFTCHILVIDHFTAVDSIKMCCVQFFVCGILSSVGMLIFEKPSVSALSDAWLEILYVGVMSSGVAYTLQMVGQKRVDPAVASIVMSLESVFAALAGWMILKERLRPAELLGCGLVFAAVILAQVPAFMRYGKANGT